MDDKYGQYNTKMIDVTKTNEDINSNRTSFNLPVPHVAVQVSNFDHAPHTQSTGQHFSSQLLLSMLLPTQSTPPQLFGIEISRVRSWDPPPHEAEHDENLLHDPHLQLTGQHFKLHFCFSWLSPLQGAPPHFADSAIFRFRVCIPPPQEALQRPNASQSPHLQSTGQHLVLHFEILVVDPLQGFPPQLSVSSFFLCAT